MTILSIESSCDETAAAIISDGQVLSSIIASQIPVHAKFGGVVPEVAAREHMPTIIPTIDQALKQAKKKLQDVDVIAVTKGPGLATSLAVGVDTAKALAAALGKPLLPVNHMEAHVYANFAKNAGNKFPALVLIVSGGHTMLAYMRNHGKIKIIGETVDDAAGEAFDKTAKLLGLGYPGGPKLSKLAELGNPTAYKFPRPMINRPDYNFSFSGLKTAVLYEIQKIKKINNTIKQNLAASIQAAIIESLTVKTEHAIKSLKPKTLMLAGGVAANKILRQEFTTLAHKHKLKLSLPNLEYCTDNAAMIGLAAYYRIKNHSAKYNYTFRAEPNLTFK